MLSNIAVKKPRRRHRLHVAVICRELGGQGSVTAVALRQAQELGFHARISLISDSFPDSVDPCLPLLITPVNLSFLRRFSHVPQELAFAFAAKRCLHRLQEQGAELDFVHCHAHSLIVLATSGFSKRFNVPCGLVAHGDVFSSPPGTYDWRLTRFFKWAIPRGYALADLIVALSPHMRERAIACGADPGKVEVIPNGIECGEIGVKSPASSQSSGDTSATEEGAVVDSLKLLFVGTLDRRKGVDVLLRAAKKLKQENLRFSLKIVGSGPLRPELDRLIGDYGLSDDVALHGSVPHGDLAKWYQWADVTCVPSINDPLPTVVLESLAVGTPIVGSAVGGIPFMIQASVNGLLVPPGDSDALAYTLAEISRQPAFLRKLKQAAAPSVLPRFSVLE